MFDVLAIEFRLGTTRSRSPVTDILGARPDLRWRVPNKYPIHSQVLAARPDAAAVVHAHPPAVVACDLAGLQLPPIVGTWPIAPLHRSRSSTAGFNAASPVRPEPRSEPYT